MRSLCMPSWVSMRMLCFLIVLGLSSQLQLTFRYEFFLTLDFDWAVLSGKKRFRWPLVKYSLLTTFCLPLIIQCRYFILPIDIFCCQLLSECKFLCCFIVEFLNGTLNELLHSAIALDTTTYDRILQFYLNPIS